MYKFILVILFFAEIIFTLQAGRVTALSGNRCRVYLSVDENILYPGQYLYVIKKADTAARIKIMEIFDSYLKAELVYGKLKKGDIVNTSEKGSYRFYINNTKIKSILEFYRGLVYENRTRLFYEEIDKIAHLFKIPANYDFNKEEELRLFLQRVYHEILKRDVKQQQAFIKYFNIVYRYFVEHKNVKHLIQDFLKKYKNSEITDDVLYLKALFFQKAGSYFHCILTCRTIIEKYLDSDHLFKTGLLLARAHYYKKEYEPALKYLEPLLESEKKSYYRDYARFLYFKILLARGEINRGLDILDKIQNDSRTVTLLKESLYLEFSLLLFRLDDRRRAVQVLTYFKKYYPDSKYIPAMKYLNAIYNKKYNDVRQNISALKEVIRKYPANPAAFKAYKEVVAILASLNRISEVYEVFNTFKRLYPEKYFRYAVSHLVAEKLIDNLLKLQAAGMDPEDGDKPGYNLLLPYYKKNDIFSNALITNKMYRQMLDKARRFFHISNFHLTNKYSIILQTLAAANYFPEIIFHKPQLYEYAVIKKNLVQIFRLYYNFSVDRKKNISRLERSLVTVLPAETMEVFYYEIFKHFRKSDEQYARRAAFKILNTAEDDLITEKIFLYFQGCLQQEKEMGYKLALYDRIKNSYRKSDAYMDRLKMSINGRKLVFYEPESIKKIKGEMIIPDNALIYNKANHFSQFDLLKDFAAHGYRGAYYYLRVNGPRPRIESRLLHLKAYKYNVIAISLNLPRGHSFSHGHIYWQNWDEFGWDLSRRIPFAINDSGDITVSIPLKSSKWQGEIKRLRLDFFDNNQNKNQNELFLKNIIIY
ncbi:MAG TPA: hypothetical protein VKS21_05765 [Spirochaetota bacterium]|nr:hypothetical protein [Spirochaetota bacterium]